MCLLLEEILPLTYFRNANDIINKLKKDKGENLYRVRHEPHNILKSIQYYLKKNNNINDIRVYGPNHGLNGYMVEIYSLSFS